ncbi:MAG: hypothetical protein OEV91_03115 [Desulfobulbaceae bacterium]|nr:hypothetical protein [Desulfobulbaceae bacterium]
MGCCYKLGPENNPYRHTILPKNLVLPIRIVVLASLAASSTYILRHFHALSPLILLGLLFHLVIVARLLGECRKSVRHHQLLAEIEADENDPEV